jgi:MATE family multidrug resistance protein
LPNTKVNIPGENSYLNANLKGLLLIVLPIMLAELSGSLMNFANRIILSSYSLDSMNASLAAAAPHGIFFFTAVSITSITEIFVGRYNGSKEFSKISEYVWQMLWFSLFATVVFAVVATYAADSFIPEYYREEGIPYFKILMYFTGLMAANVALSAFYIGRGKVTLVILTVVISNVINFILDLILVFGFDSIIPALGTKGAAISSVIAYIVQFVILFLAFLNSYNRTHYHTYNYKINYDMLKQGLTTAAPGCIGNIVEMIAWAVFVYIIADTNQEYMIIYSIGSTALALFSFVTDALYKAVSTIAANLIGAQDYSNINKLSFSGIKLILYLSGLLFIPLVLKPAPFIELFIKGEEVENLGTLIKSTLVWVWAYFVFSNILWVFGGILIAARDTIFMGITNTILVLICAVLPSISCLFLHKGPPDLVWKFYVLYTIIASLVFYYRCKSKKLVSFLQSCLTR